MPSAESGPDQFHALEAHWREWVFPFPGIDRRVALHSFRPSQSAELTRLNVQAVRNCGSLYACPLVMMAQTIRAVLLASAAAAIFVVRRANNCTSHGRRVPCRSANRITAMAPTNNS